MPEHVTTPISFARKHHDISKAAQSLHESLRDAFAEFLRGDAGGRSVARRLGVDKMLGWQAHRIATAPDPATIISALPGERGMTLLIEALVAAGVSDVAVERVTTTAAELRRIFERSNASRQEITAIAAGGLDSAAQQRHQAKVKKAHFDSTVALRGEVANAMVSTWFVTPAKADPAHLSLVSLNMKDGLRTIRPMGPRLVHRGTKVDVEAESLNWSRLDASAKANPIPSLVPAASTPNLDGDVVQVVSKETATLVLADPDLHPDGALTLTFADLIDDVGSMHAQPDMRTGQVGVHVSIPIRHLYLDVLFDESLPAVDPAAALYFAAAERVEYGEHAELRRFNGDIDGRFVRTARLPKSSKVDPALHKAMLEHGAALIGRPLDAFRCFRMHIAYPPTFTRAIVKWLLPEAPES
ncbi:MAG: hypothetical protein CMJ23_07780 [Phycisphaerae bacterium]|nr:hypothetical protein [Phycisphaerae bacterium]